MAFSFIHAADLHLDTPFSATGRYPDHIASVLRDASLVAFDRLIEAAVAEQVGFVAFAGDIYDGAERGIRAQVRFRDGLARLAEAGIRSFVAHGNHDPVEEGWSAVERFADLVTIFPSNTVLSVPFEAGGEQVTVHGISYATAHTAENLSQRFTRPSTPGLHVGVLHCNVGSDPAHEAYSPCSVSELEQVGLDYWALGHIHSRRVLRRDPWVVYSGNLQGRSIRETERGAKGALVVEVESGRCSEPRLLSFDQVRFESVEVNASQLDFEQLMDALLAAGNDARVAADGRALLLSATITGRADLHERLRDGLRDTLLAQLREAAEVEEPFIWWDSLALQTRADLDLASLAQGDDFLADVLSTAAEWRTEPGRIGQGLDGMSAEVLRLLESADTSSEMENLLEEATILAVELLVASQP